MSPDAATHERYMGRCIELARGALATNDAPVGAVVVSEEQIVGEGVEGVKAHSDVTAHAEIAALRAACRRLGTLDLSGCTLYTSVEPCVMCALSIRLARVAAVVTGAARRTRNALSVVGRCSRAQMSCLTGRFHWSSGV